MISAVFANFVKTCCVSQPRLQKTMTTTAVIAIVMLVSFVVAQFPTNIQGSFTGTVEIYRFAPVLNPQSGAFTGALLCGTYNASQRM